MVFGSVSKPEAWWGSPVPVAKVGVDLCVRPLIDVVVWARLGIQARDWAGAVAVSSGGGQLGKGVRRVRSVYGAQDVPAWGKYYEVTRYEWSGLCWESLRVGREPEVLETAGK